MKKDNHQRKSCGCHHRKKSKDCQINITTKCDLPKLKYVRGSASPTPENDVFLESFPYVGIEGQLSNFFDPNTGKFTAKKRGIYQFAYYITWQDQAAGDKRNDGDRLSRLVRTFAQPRIENSFIGQYHSVPSQKVGISPFYTVMSIPAILEMEVGDTVQLGVYQNNTDQDGIIAFIEFHIIKSSEFCPTRTFNPTLTGLDQVRGPRSFTKNSPL